MERIIFTVRSRLLGNGGKEALDTFFMICC